jgi:hypothetical protein
MLKFKLNKEAYEALSEAEKSFYKADGDNYQLDVEGAVDKDKLAEFRNTNIELSKKMDMFKDVDLDKWNELQKLEQDNKDKELIDKKDFDGLIEQKTAAVRSDYEAKLQAITEENQELSGKYTSTVSKYEIEGAATKAFSAHKINPDFNPAVLAEIRSMFTVDNGQVVAKDGDKILTGKNGNLTIDEFIASKPESYKIQSNAGNGRGGNGQPLQSNSNQKGSDLIREGLSEL